MALERDQCGDRAHERKPDHDRAAPSGGLAPAGPPAEGVDEAAGQWEREDEPGPGGCAHPRSSRRSSTLSGSRRRNMATIRPRPTTTSHAATTMTISANTCPSALP